jgi:hypothetical protein
VDYTFTPYVGVGPVRFGLSRRSIETELGESPSPVRRHDKILGTTRIFFDGLGVMVDLDETDACCSIEMTGSSRLVYQGTDWLPSTYGEVLERLHCLALPVIEEHDGLRCDGLGFACWAPDKADDEADPMIARVQSVFLYRRGYHAWVEEKIRTRGPWEPTEP